ncbi:hypothetical protein ACFLT5_00040 [Chloroflexota bacterium]
MKDALDGTPHPTGLVADASRPLLFGHVQWFRLGGTLSGRKRKQDRGNISLNRAPGSLTPRIIYSVLVLGKHRERAMGRQLIEADMEEA